MQNTDTRQDAQPIWQTYPPGTTANETPKQRALIDAISALSYLTEGSPDCTSTAELALIVGCDVESAWHALSQGGVADVYYPDPRPEGVPMWPEEAPCRVWGLMLWAIPEDPWADDEDWYRHRIAESNRLGRPDAAEHWRRESLTEVERDEEDRQRKIDAVAADHARRQTGFDFEGASS